MSQQINYQFCNYSILSGVTVTFTTGTTYSDNFNIFGCIFYNDYTPLQWSIPHALPEDLRVYYTAYSKSIQNGVVTYEGVQTLSVLFPAGQTVVGFPVSHYSHFNCAADNNYEGWQNSWTLAAQPYLPTECSAQPTGCTLQITGGTMVTPSVRGAADGSIHVYISGETGSTISYKLNGVLYLSGTSANNYNFTGLTTGYYQVWVQNGLCYSTYDFQLPDGQFSTGNIKRTTPASLSAVNNPVVLTLQTAVNSDLPLQAQSRIKVNGTITQNNSIEFNLNYPLVYQATFTAKNFPDKNTYFLASVLSDENGATVGSNTANEIASSIAECLQQDLVISRLYYISTDNQYINLIAKESTPNLNLTSLQVHISGANIALETQVLGVGAFDGQLTADYSLYAEIFVDPTLEYGATPIPANYRRVAELELPYQQDNVHKFQLETVLKNYVSSPAIDFTSTGFTTIPSYDCSYYVRYGEKFPLIANSNTKKKRYKQKTYYYQVCNAALDYEEPNTMATYLGVAATGLNPNFGYYWNGYNQLSFTGLTTTTGTTSIQYSLYSGATKVRGWSNSGATFSGMSYGVYQAKVSGVTDGVTFTVQKTFTFNVYNMANGLGFYYSPTTTLPRGYIPWLTNSPSTLYCQRDSKQYLSFLLEKGYATANRTLSVKGDLYFYNGTSTTGVTFFNLTSGSTTNFGGCTMLSCGYDELGLAAYENSGNTKIRRVDFAVWQDDSVFGDVKLTEVKTFLYEIDENVNRFGTALLNRLGTWDVFDWVGEVVRDENVSRQTLQVPREIKSDGSSPLGFIANSVYDTQYVKKWVVNSGTIDGQTYDWLQELLQSNKIYRYNDIHQNFLIVDGYTANKSTNTNDFSLQVTFIETLFENNIGV